MKKIMVLMTLAAALVVLVAGASAETAVRLKANIPFAFYAGTELLPAGQYTFAMLPDGLGSASSTSVVIRNQDGKIATRILTMAGSDVRSMINDHLHFNCYGDKHFLAKVESVGSEANLKVTKAEQELRAAAKKAQDAVLVAEKY
jgi:hypothetical protein